MRCCLKKTGPRETSFIHAEMQSMSGSQMGNETRIAAMSKVRFHLGSEKLLSSTGSRCGALAGREGRVPPTAGNDPKVG